MVKRTFIILLLILLNSCTAFKKIPQPEREFRGFWVATVVNIDWPKNGSDSAEKQKKDFLEILDFYQNLNFNTAIVQIRTAGDAFYPSEYAPWSRFLTGIEGEVSEEKSQLLPWLIEQTHKRGMEFHAWLNPYRATFDLNTEILSNTHDYNQHPGWLLKYGKKYYYDPGLPEVQNRMVGIIDEVVSNYDVDAIHFDDYFYPYTINGEIFHDSLSYYNCALPERSLDDWRRSNIDSLVRKSHDIIKKRKPWVQFGISPFGVWKNKSTDPKGSDTKAGQTTFENLYADPLLWMEKGWLDYVIPQVYWSMELPVASHRKIVDWWSNNSQNANLYIGNGPYKIRNNSDKAWGKKRELPNQLLYARKKSDVQGNAFFSAKSLMKNNKDILRILKRKYYKNPVPQPSRPLKGMASVKTPFLENASFRAKTLVVNFDDLSSFKFAYIFPEKKMKTKNPFKKVLDQVYVTNRNKISIPKKKFKNRKRLAVLFVDKYGRESEPIIVHLNKTN